MLVTGCLTRITSVPECAVSYVGFLWGSVAVSPTVGFLWGSRKPLTHLANQVLGIQVLQLLHAVTDLRVTQRGWDSLTQERWFRACRLGAREVLARRVAGDAPTRSVRPLTTAYTATRACRTADPERGTVPSTTTEIANSVSCCDMLLLCHDATRPPGRCGAGDRGTANRVRSFSTLSVFAPKVAVYDG
jgi:hypothetical protein